MSSKPIYRITFVNRDKIYEIYAHSVGASGIPGFVEIAELSFGERSAIVLDPGEEGLKNEFSGVRRSHVPMHHIIRIDEVEKRGTARVSEAEGNIAPFPGTALPGRNTPS